MISEDTYRTPGQLVAALLDERGWTQPLLAMVLGQSLSMVQRITSDKRAIDAEMALALSEVFNVPAERFIALQQSYDLARARIEVRPDPRRAARAHLFSSLPVSQMAERGWLGDIDVKNLPQLESAIARFFGAPSLDEIETLPHAARKTSVSAEATPVQLAWLYRVRQIAQEVVVPPYSTAAMQKAIGEMRSLLASAEEVRHVPRILAEAGVRFVIVETLGSAKIDGVCFWLDDRSPVIGMTMRHDRIDNFWFVLRHECEHVLRGDGRAIVTIDSELEKERAGVSGEVAEQERAANEAAANFCVPAKTLKQFIARKAPIFTERDILGFAKVVQVHPGLVAGQLQHATQRYERFRAHLAKVRSIVLPNVMHDGWGDVAPVDL